MATFSVLKFPTSDGAGRMVKTMESLQNQGLIRLEDAAIVTWPANKDKPKTKQLHNLKGAGALGGSFWGLLFGLLFFVPLLGMAVGAAMGALAGSMANYGISKEVIEEIKAKVTPGTSAVFLLTSGAVMDKVMDAIRGTDFELISTNLSKEDEARLMDAFAEEAEEKVPQMV